ncbi:MAG TPA: beta-ketoacyl synthase N-terminal-like domain-containing protein [Casimicrobiaceae bacterium]|nr:beta-ketoacyl synthase N-terminal-like domain-containing protein [Casimicrobiaceae bacterium]
MKIVITGSGAVCGTGKTPEALFEAARDGRSAIAPIQQWDVTGWPVQNAAEIADFNARELVPDRKLHKFIRRTDMLGIFAGTQAIARAGIVSHRDVLPTDAAAAFSDRSGVYVGSGGGAYNTQYEYFPLMTEAGGDMVRFGEELGNVVNPMWLLRTLPNNVLCHVGINHNLKGSNACITNHSCGGTLAVIEALEALRTGEADRAVAVGHDTLVEPQMVLYYNQCGLLASDTIRPFDANRSGSLFGEGAGALVLETEESATARNANVIGEVLGGGNTSEATGLIAIRDDGDGLARAIGDALHDAKLGPADIGMIVAHGNGTRQSDASEAAALRKVFGASMPPVTAFKWSIGHLIAAAGIIEAVMALEALKENVVPGVATLRALDPDCDGVPVSSTAQVPRSKTALILCRGFAGTDAALVVRAA